MFWEACVYNLFVATAVGADIFIDIANVDIRELRAQFVGGVQRGRAADARAVVVHLAVRLGLVDAVKLAAAHAVNEGNIVHRLVVPRAVLCRSSFKRQQADELGQGDHFWKHAVAIFTLVRFVRLEAGGHDDRADIDFKGFGLVLQMQYLPVELDTAIDVIVPIDGRRWRVAAIVGTVDRLALGQAVVKLIGHFHRAGGHRLFGNVSSA